LKELQVAIESTREKLIFYALVPIVAAAAGALVTNLIQGQQCLPASGDDLITILKDQSMTAPQKLQALEVYKEVTGRPWSVVATISGSIMAIGGVAIGLLLSRKA
jgi:hypothetical protein